MTSVIFEYYILQQSTTFHISIKKTRAKQRSTPYQATKVDFGGGPGGGGGTEGGSISGYDTEIGGSVNN